MRKKFFNRCGRDEIVGDERMGEESIGDYLISFPRKLAHKLLNQSEQYMKQRVKDRAGKKDSVRISHCVKYVMYHSCCQTLYSIDNLHTM